MKYIQKAAIFFLCLTLLCPIFSCVSAAKPAQLSEPVVACASMTGEHALELIDVPEVLDRVEAHRFDHELVGVSKQQVYLDTLSGRTVANPASIFVGDDEAIYPSGSPTFSLYLVVYRDSSYNYYVYGTADWDSNVSLGGSTGPASGFDHIGVGWGSNELVKEGTSDSCIGAYRNGEELGGTKEHSNSYGGFSWFFNDRQDRSGSGAEYIDCYVKLTQVHSGISGGATSIRLSYVHTYTTNSVTVNFLSGPDGLPTYSVSGTEQYWNTEVDVSGILY